MNNGPCVIGLDLGTTNSKAVALDAHGKQLASASSDYRLYSPRSGWAEQKVEEVWQGVLSALKALAGKLPLRTQGIEIAGMSLSGAMHSSLAVDAHGQPLAPALTWADQRAAPQAEALRQRCDRSGALPAHRLPAGFDLPPGQAALVAGTGPRDRSQGAYFTLIKDWILVPPDRRMGHRLQHHLRHRAAGYPQAGVGRRGARPGRGDG